MTDYQLKFWNRMEEFKINLELNQLKLEDNHYECNKNLGTASFNFKKRLSERLISVENDFNFNGTNAATEYISEENQKVFQGKIENIEIKALQKMNSVASLMDQLFPSIRMEITNMFMTFCMKMQVNLILANKTNAVKDLLKEAENLNSLVDQFINLIEAEKNRLNSLNTERSQPPIKSVQTQQSKPQPSSANNSVSKPAVTLSFANSSKQVSPLPATTNSSINLSTNSISTPETSKSATKASDQQSTQKQTTIDQTSPKSQLPPSSPQPWKISWSSLESLENVHVTIESFEKHISQLKDDPSHKVFCRLLRGKVNGLLCKICCTEPQRLLRLVNELTNVFSGKPVKIDGQNERLSVKIHPLGLELAIYYLYHSIILQGETQFTEATEALSYFASLIAALFGQLQQKYSVLLMAYMISACPLLAPIFDASEMDKLSKNSKRNLGLSRLYTAILIARPPPNLRKSDHLSVSILWRLVAMLANNDPMEPHSSDILFGIFEIGGASLLKQYGGQLLKLIFSIYESYQSSMQPSSIRLTTVIESALKNKCFPYKGELDPEFWNS